MQHPFGHTIYKEGVALPSNSARLYLLYQKLATLWGPQQWWPSDSALETMVGACLGQGTAWKAVERSLANLRARGLLQGRALYALPEAELRELIRPSGFMERKARTLRLLLELIAQQYKGSIPRMAAAPTAALREQLLTIHGIGPETADSILLYALGHPAMVVDEYLRRVVVRHGLMEPPARYAALQEFALSAFEPAARKASAAATRLKAKTTELRPRLPQAKAPARDAHQPLAVEFNEFHALIVEVGKAYCSRKPNCEHCPLREDLQKYQNDQPIAY